MYNFGIKSQISAESTQQETISCVDVQGEDVADRCYDIALSAMSHFFPRIDIISIQVKSSDYIKKDLLTVVDDAIARYFRDMTEEEKGSILMKRKHLSDLLSRMEFRQYYHIEVEVPCVSNDNPHKTSTFYMIAVSTDFSVGVIFRNMKERAKYRRSLGPKYMAIYNLKTEILQDILWLNAKKDSAINSCTNS